MRPDAVVRLPQLSVQQLRLPKRVEDLPVLEFVAEPAVDVLYEAILPRRAKLRLTGPSRPGCCPRRVRFGHTLDHDPTHSGE